jgi:hypothetical protein
MDGIDLRTNGNTDENCVVESSEYDNETTIGSFSFVRSSLSLLSLSSSNIYIIRISRCIHHRSFASRPKKHDLDNSIIYKRIVFNVYCCQCS